MTPLAETGRTRRQGSKISFLPDKEVFETLEMNYDTIVKRLRELAYLNRGILFRISDERERGKQKSSEFKFEGGLSDFVNTSMRIRLRFMKSRCTLRGRRWHPGRNCDAAQ